MGGKTEKCGNKKWASDLHHVATTKLPLLHSCPDGVQRELTVWDSPEHIIYDLFRRRLKGNSDYFICSSLQILHPNLKVLGFVSLLGIVLQTTGMDFEHSILIVRIV